MSEKRVEELLYERGRALDGPVLPEDAEQRLRAELAAEARAEASFRPRRWALVAAAAAVLALALGYLLRTPGAASPIEAQVATLESAALIAEHRALHGLDAQRLPDLDRGSDSDGPPPAEVVAYAAQAEQRAVERALSRGADESVAAWFKVAFRPERDCSAVVLQVDPDGEVRQSYPDATQPGFAPNRFAAGRVHVLPRPSVTLTDTPGGPAYEYEQGFLRPRSVDRLVVVLGLRGEPLDEDFDAALADFLQAQDPRGGAATADVRAARLSEWLEERSFSVRLLSVRRS